MKNITILYAIILLLVMNCLSNKVYSQATSAGNLNIPVTTSPLDYIDWAAGVGQPVLIKNYDVNQPINFWTNYTNFTTTPRMTILGNNNAWPLIGIATATPTTILDIIPPALNNSYALNDTTVLQNWGVYNIFCGVGAGYSNSITSTGLGGYSNSFFGYNAGYNNIYGFQNTFTGNLAGYSNIGYTGTLYGSYNTFNGEVAGYSNDSGYRNAFSHYAA